jgi:hypothetical protein
VPTPICLPLGFTHDEAVRRLDALTDELVLDTARFDAYPHIGLIEDAWNPTAPEYSLLVTMVRQTLKDDLATVYFGHRSPHFRHIDRIMWTFIDSLRVAMMLCHDFGSEFDEEFMIENDDGDVEHEWFTNSPIARLQPLAVTAARIRHRPPAANWDAYHTILNSVGTRAVATNLISYTQ